jgi:tRNA(fMet)-specific endonuclease VapC
MNADSVLLDTSIVLELLRRKDRIIAQKLIDRMVYLPSIVQGELLLGAYASSFPKVMKETKEFFQTCTVLIPNEQTSDIYGRVGADLRRTGRPIPTNDLWVAAMALEHNLPLAARDLHFSYVTGLTVLQW